MGVMAPFLSPRNGAGRARLKASAAPVTGDGLLLGGRRALGRRSGARRRRGLRGGRGAPVPVRGGRSRRLLAVAAAARCGEERQQHERDDNEAVNESGNPRLVLPHVACLPHRLTSSGRLRHRTERGGRGRGPFLRFRKLGSRGGNASRLRTRMDVVATDVRTDQAESEDRRRRRGRTWPERIALALPGAFLAVVFGFFFITKTSEAWTATKSVQAILVIAGIIGGWVLLGWLLRRFVPWAWVRSAVLSMIAVAIAVAIVRPYYVDTVDNTKLVKGSVQDASQAARPAAPGPAPSPVGPVRVSSGQLRGIDHSARGEAAIIRQPDGSYVVRFSNFDINRARIRS